jgi:hypothetical protein
VVSLNNAEIEALFARTLLGEYEGDEAWTAVNTLRQDGAREIFDHAAAWLLSGDRLKRARAADILCQLRRAPVSDEPGGKPEPEWMFREESYFLVTKVLEKEEDPLVLNSAIHALGHLSNAEAVSLILHHQNHPEEKVRFAVTFALGRFPNDPQSVDGLLRLASDAASDVRDWAVFGLGVQGDADSPEIREALLRCLDDTDENVREEAAVGLGKRQDQRLIPQLLKMLDQPELKYRVAKAAADLLGLSEDPPEWVGADYKAALTSKFQISE